MQKLRGLVRLTALTLLTLTLMAALALPSAAAKVCSATQMLGEVEIVSVRAKESPAVWSVQGLVKFDYGGDIENGLLEVSFKDIATDFDFDGYIIEAVPGDDDPGDSRKLGVPDYKSPSLIARPAVVGDTITEVLNLEPGTKYYVTVHAVNHNTVQISPDQRAQDSMAATTLLSAPFLGALEVLFYEWNPTSDPPGWTDIKCNPTTARTFMSNPAHECRWRTWYSVGLWSDNSDYEGTHFAFHEADDEDGQHYFRWLNPAQYGPYDHLLDNVRDQVGNDDSKGQADMLSLDKAGKVEDHCADADINGDCGHTHYLFKAVDEDGNTVASELVETGGNLVYSRHAERFDTDDSYFQVVFTAESGELTFSVSLGRVDKGAYRAMSDTASVTVNVPRDLRDYDQTGSEYLRVPRDIWQKFLDDNDDKGNGIAGRWLGEKGSGAGRSLWNPRAEEELSDLLGSPLELQLVFQAYLNNQLK